MPRGRRPHQCHIRRQSRAASPRGWVAAVVGEPLAAARATVQVPTVQGEVSGGGMAAEVAVAAVAVAVVAVAVVEGRGRRWCP